MPVRHARSETRGRPPLGRRGGVGKNGSTRIPQRLWKQRSGHSRLRYFADSDQVPAVLLHALRRSGVDGE